ncbi:uncharacterized protein BDCG_17272 [Blastomyces dermatitidis ER-3]|uniref:Uncharacterized protein n=1 Tax=Ajellomyces dermatitidis (strain ER-3 / ATCC MYA-2586) TaxID=559297 RepID=A0ABX2VXM7_AJEDR|nr:uncharacterized protein BDCG_17272 [Blastomyces dermatitidis ER-3]OAT01897.1 hypothetical protein BDCG_17272 [Blastomyces dermatitidis ER-3]
MKSNCFESFDRGKRLIQRGGKQMSPRTRATAGLLNTPASNMDMNEEYGQDTPTPMLRRGEMGSQTGGQMNENTMIRMMMDYMKKQDK